MFVMYSCTVRCEVRIKEFSYWCKTWYQAAINYQEWNTWNYETVRKNLYHLDELFGPSRLNVHFHHMLFFNFNNHTTTNITIGFLWFFILGSLIKIFRKFWFNKTNRCAFRVALCHILDVFNQCLLLYEEYNHKFQ